MSTRIVRLAVGGAAIALPIALFGCRPNVVNDGSSGVGGGTSTLASDTGGTATTSASGGGGSAAFDCDPPREATTVANSLDGSSSQIALDHRFAYFAEPSHGRIKQASLCNHLVTVFARGERSPNAIAVDAAHVVWGSSDPSGALRIAPIEGGRPKTIWSGAPIYSLALDHGRIYFAAYNKAIVAIDEDGSNAVELATGSVGQYLAIDDETVYFSDGSAELVKVPKRGGSVERIEALTDEVEGVIAARRGTVFTAVAGAASGSNIVGIAPNGSAPRVLATVNAFGWVSTTDSQVAWLSEDAVFIQPIPGGKVTTLSTSESRPGEIVTRGSAIAWMANGHQLRWMALR